MKKYRYGLKPPLLTAVGIAMIGWLRATFVGVEWLLGGLARQHLLSQQTHVSRS
jgi:hypothetical protein